MRSQAKACATLLLTCSTWAQQFDQRGFIENRTLVYPQEGANDTGHVVDEMLLRWEVSYEATPWLSLRGAFDARSDTHRQVARTWDLDIDGRNIQRPALSIRRASAVVHRGGFTGEIGRQFIRWGKTDILTPTDRFAPRDFLASVVDSDFLGVWATRATYEHGGDTFDAIWQPHFTPARAPLLNQRWTIPPQQVGPFAVTDGGALYPGGSQWGVRWNHVASGYEYSVSYFDGYQALPSFDAQLRLPVIELTRVYPRLRMVGGDGAVPLPWFTLKGEAAYLSSPTRGAEEYVLYVLQVERFVGEWFFVGGYAGSAITREASNPLQFAPDRGFAKSFVGRAGWTIDANRSLAVETAVRAGGSFLRFEYSHAYGQHWRATAGAAWIRGDDGDFLGQYNRNSYLSLAMRYSF